ncbi:hypothetical protein [Paenibacillus agilis]|uniref:DUF2334 domain-containing protein n=1 Tax=Paenibacillus agilis TaxID=3020863 RepID=A0A559J196_9BACL|nr:hypothetical protein [Paenibacillus agilis]TVX93647.1 hypothetical protein FPZ44_11600 [Paenibacillus agilis]
MLFKATNKILLLLMIVLLVMITIVPAPAAHAEADKPVRVLLLYDSLAKGTTKSGNVEALQHVLAAYSVAVTLQSYDNYKQGDLQQYTKVIGIHNVPDIAITNQDFVRDFTQYRGSYLHIGTNVPAMVQSKLNLQTTQVNEDTFKLSIDDFSQQAIQTEVLTYITAHGGTPYGLISSRSGRQSPFGVGHDGIAYVPYFEKGNLSELAIGYVLRDWLGWTQQSNTYVVFKEIYPFSDLERLEQLSDELYEAGIPFVVSVRPIFINLDYPATKRYFETLKYVQSRNGNLVVNVPEISAILSPLKRDLNNSFEMFIDAMVKQGVAPLGFGAEMYWTYDQYFTNSGLGLFDTAILFGNEEIKHKEQAYTSKSYPSTLYSVQLDFLEQFEYREKALTDFPMNTAITFNFNDNGQELNEAVKWLRDSWVTFADLKYGDHSVVTQANKIRSSGGSLYINDQLIDLASAREEVSEEYEYKPKEQKSFERWFNVQNKVFIVIILVTIVAFGGFFIIGHRLYKRKYFK